MFTTPAGLISVAAALVSVAGIVFVGMAGMSKERELPEEEKKKAVAEFNFKKGMMVALFSGLMSSGMSFGLQGGPEIQKLAQAIEPRDLGDLGRHAGAGGGPVGRVHRQRRVVHPAEHPQQDRRRLRRQRGAPLAPNFIYAGLAGAIWCSQFICFKTGEPQMGRTSYIGWAVLMASQILFSQLLGLKLGEWKGSGQRTIRLLIAGLALLMVSAVVAGYGGYVGARA